MISFTQKKNRKYYFSLIAGRNRNVIEQAE